MSHSASAVLIAIALAAFEAYLMIGGKSSSFGSECDFNDNFYPRIHVALHLFDISNAEKVSLNVSLPWPKDTICTMGHAIGSYIFNGYRICL
jgi:hypothetical protein